MKKLVLLVGIMLISTFTFAQKKEVKKAEKAIKNGEVAEAISLLNQAEGLIAGADSDLQSQFYLTKAEAYLADAGNNNFDKMKTAAKAIGKAEELGNADAERLSIVKQNLRVALVNSAINDQNAKNYASASEKLYTSYMTNKKDTSDLYYAAGNSVNGKDYTTAVGYYKTLLDLGYTGIRTEYVATELETEKVVAFADKGERDLALLTGNYTKPEERKTESVKGDILQKITLIYVSQGENEKALEFMKSAREANPDDTDLIRSEADLAYKMGDMAKYDKL
ncbi:MAG: hypothetical protein KJO77_07275, partial [Bacteroidia bacterium]|nr:hypothetical protein [Bacteroidia bacterium]